VADTVCSDQRCFSQECWQLRLRRHQYPRWIWICWGRHAG